LFGGLSGLGCLGLTLNFSNPKALPRDVTEAAIRLLVALLMLNVLFTSLALMMYELRTSLAAFVFKLSAARLIAR
ncbi:hypothetical protein, partial [Brevibacillus centrosporus]|uniref:hypothetical protein n=1 Tax=Brevibacillus centrosporus TaxID=54910 RepID=UPI001476A062